MSESDHPPRRDPSGRPYTDDMTSWCREATSLLEQYSKTTDDGAGDIAYCALRDHLAFMRHEAEAIDTCIEQLWRQKAEASASLVDTIERLTVSLRDQFAMAALGRMDIDEWGGGENMAKSAYQIADAMLAERAKGDGGGDG